MAIGAVAGTIYAMSSHGKKFQLVVGDPLPPIIITPVLLENSETTLMAACLHAAFLFYFLSISKVLNHYVSLNLTPLLQQLATVS